MSVNMSERVSEFLSVCECTSQCVIEHVGCVNVSVCVCMGVCELIKVWEFVLG